MTSYMWTDNYEKARVEQIATQVLAALVSRTDSNTEEWLAKRAVTLAKALIVELDK